MNEEGIIALDELLLHEAPCSVVGPTDAPDTRSECCVPLSLSVPFGGLLFSFLDNITRQWDSVVIGCLF